MRSHAQPGRSPACKKAAVWFFDRGYKLPLLPAGSMTTTSFFCRKKALWPFPPITLPRPEPFVNPAPQILQLLCRAARLCATVPTSAVVFRQIPPLFRRPGPSMIMVQRGSGQRRPESQSRRQHDTDNSVDHSFVHKAYTPLTKIIEVRKHPIVMKGTKAMWSFLSPHRRRLISP